MTVEPNSGGAMVDATGAPRDPLIGLRIGSFVLMKLLASGGMGVLYIARHYRSPHIKRAVKLLLPEYARVQAIQQRFVREAEATAKLQHENIIKIEDYGTLPMGSARCTSPTVTPAAQTRTPPTGHAR